MSFNPNAGAPTNTPNSPSSTLAPVAIPNIATGGNINPAGTSGLTGNQGASTTVDVNSLFVCTQTTAGQALTIPTPTVTTGGRYVTIKNSSSSTQSFTMNGTTLGVGKSADYMWDGAVWVITESGLAQAANIINTYTVDASSANIAVGDVVSWFNNNAIKAIVQGSPTPGTEVTAAANAQAFVHAAVLDTSHFVLMYNNASSFGTVVVGTISGTAVTFGTPLVFTSAAIVTYYFSLVVTDSTHFYASFRNDSAGNIQLGAFTVTGTNIAMTGGPSTLVVDANARQSSLAVLSSTLLVCCYYTATDGKIHASAIAVTPGAIGTIGSNVSLTNANSGNSNSGMSAVGLDATHFAVSFTDASQTGMWACAGSVAGTVVSSPTASLQISSSGGIGAVSSPASSAMLDSTHFVTVWKNATSTFLSGVVCSVSGTTITAGAQTAIVSSAVTGAGVMATGASQFVTTYKLNSDNKLYVVNSTVVGTAITPGSPYLLGPSLNNSLSVPLNISTTHQAVVYLTSGSLPAATAILLGTMPGVILGMASNAATPTQVVNVVYDGICNGLTGLTAGVDYYWSPFGAGSLTSTLSTYKVGSSTSTTSMLVGPAVLTAYVPQSVVLSSIAPALQGNTIDNLTFAQNWNWSTQTVTTPLTLTGNSAGTNPVLALGSAYSTLKGTDYSTIGSTNDVDFGNTSLIRLTGASAQTITGITKPTDGKRLTIVNAAANAATISNQSASSVAANRILTGTGADLSLAADASAQLVYDSGATRWRVVGGSAGASSVEYVEAYLTATTAVANATQVPFTTAVGTIPNTTGTFSLTAGKTYRLQGAVLYTGTEGAQTAAMSWYNITGATYIQGSYSTGDSMSKSGNNSMQTFSSTTITPVTNITVQLRNVSGVSLTIQSGYSWANITQIGATNLTGVAMNLIAPALNTNTIDNLAQAQTWNWSTATTQTPLSLTAGALTTGSLLSLTGTAAAAALKIIEGTIEIENTVSPTVSPASRGRIAYNSTTQTFQTSVNGGAYTSIGANMAVQRFTTSGTYTPTTGMQYAIVEILGGGGAAGGSPATAAAQVSCASGGGGGGYAKFFVTAAQVGASQTVTIGAGGVGAAGTTGGTGGSTSFGALAVASGGVGGNVGGPSTSTEAMTPGTGGIATVTTGTPMVTIKGGRGSTSNVDSVVPATYVGCGGASALGFSADVTPYLRLVAIGGIVNLTAGSNNSGVGGGGNAIPASTVVRTGVAGGSGICIITEYI
jgi:hypothetical protein